MTSVTQTQHVQMEPPLLDRERELELLDAALQRAVSGMGSMVVVEGVAGIGKTRLLRATRMLAEERGLSTLVARGSELEQQFPFGIARQLLEPVLTPELLDGAAQGAAHVFGPAGSADRGELATLHGLHWLTLNASAGPQALFIDDLHWADAASLRYLAYLQPRLAELPIVVVGVVRSGERSADRALLRTLLADSDVELVEPRPLGLAAVIGVIEQALGVTCDPEFGQACAEATAGNPFLLAALTQVFVREGVAPSAENANQVRVLGPTAVARQVNQRLGRLDETARAVAEALTVLGASASLSVVADVAGVDLLVASDRAEELATLGLVELAGTEPTVSYVHPIVGAAVYDAMSLRARAEAHVRAAQVLWAAGAAPERVAAHILRTPPGLDPNAADRLHRAAVAADAQGSPEAAFAFYERCLREELTPDVRTEVLAAAAQLAVLVDLDAAIALLSQLRAGQTEPAARAIVDAHLGVAYGFLRDPDRAVASFRDALVAVPAQDEDRRRRLEATLLVGAAVAPGHRSIADRVPLLRALPAHDSLGGRMLEATIAMHEMAAADPAGAVRARVALADGRLLREANGEGALVAAWLTLLAADDPVALESIEDAVRLAHVHGSLRALAPAYTFRALGRLWTGQLADAETDAREALRLARTGRVDMDVTFAAAYLAGALIEQGRLADAEAALRDVDIPPTRPRPRPDYYALDVYARLRRRQGRPGEAVAAAMEAGRVWTEFGFVNPAVGAWRSEAALALYALGDPAGARRQAEEEVALARHWGAPRALGRALRVLGQVTGGPDGLALLEESFTTLKASTALLEQALSWVEYGGALRRAGQRSRARDALTQALDVAELSGAVAVAEQARVELRAAGYRPRREHLTGSGSLTASERRVAELAAAGASNRDIAQALFVTVKTVEVHLTSAYRKLGVTRRHDLGAALAAPAPRR